MPGSITGPLGHGWSTREAVVAAARHCVGTRFRHQGRIPLVGLDCAGLVMHAGFSTGAAAPFEFTGYSHIPDPALVRRMLRHNLDPVTEMADGNVLLFSVQGITVHMGIVASSGQTYIHCIAQYPRRVVEESLDRDALSNVRGVFRYRGIID